MYRMACILLQYTIVHAVGLCMHMKVLNAHTWCSFLERKGLTVHGIFTAVGCLNHTSMLHVVFVYI